MIAILQFMLVSVHMALEVRGVYVVVDGAIDTVQTAAAVAVISVDIIPSTPL